MAMALSTELREALASRHRPRLRCQVREPNDECSDTEQPLGSEDAGDYPDPDDSGPRLVVRVTEQNVEKIYTLPALPPPSPNWSHLLCGRPHEAASAPLARMALLAVGCRLSISPTPDMLLAAAKCHSAGAVRSLLVRVFGERGLSSAYQLAGREQPHKRASRVDGVTGSDATPAAPVNCDPLEPGLVEAISRMPTKLQRWMLAPPRDPPRWRTSPPSDEMDDGAWCG